MRVKLTDSAIRSYQPRAAQYAIGDAACPGLCVRITLNGVVVRLRRPQQGHRQVSWLTIGCHRRRLTRAREIANDAHKAVANGGTPLPPCRARCRGKKS